MIISSVTSNSVPATTHSGARETAQTAPATPDVVLQKTTETASKASSPERVDKAVKQVNDAFTQNGQNLHVFIEYDKATGIAVVKIQDKNTREVISQFPPKAIIAMAEAIDQSLDKKGQMMDVSA